MDVSPTDLAAVLARLVVELDEWELDEWLLPYAKAGTAPMSVVAAARKIPRRVGMTSSCVNQGALPWLINYIQPGASAYRNFEKSPGLRPGLQFQRTLARKG